MRRPIRRNSLRDGLLAAAAFLAGALLPSSAMAADPRFEAGRAHWLAKQYPPAKNTLLGYRNAVKAKKPSVDYMLGTSGCRIGQRQWGANVLAFVLYRYQLTPRSRVIIERERNLCRAPAPMPALGTDEVEVAVNGLAGATSRGKMGYWVEAQEPVAAFPARAIGTVDEDALRRRLVPFGSAGQLEAELRTVAPAGARVAFRSRYAFVTSAGHSDRELTQIQSQLDRYLSFLESEYGLRLPDNYLTLYLVKDQEELTVLARRLHQLDVSPSTIGYTFQDDQSAVAIIPGSVIGTLFHEIFHLVVRTSFGDIPQWLDEGMASLYEVSAFDRSRVVGLPNWRGEVLDTLWSTRPPLTEVLGASWFASDTPGTDSSGAAASLPLSGRALTEKVAAQFATARYFMLYLQERGKLRDVYRAVQHIQPWESENPQAAVRQAVSRELGPLDGVQTAFDQWFASTRGRAASRPPGEVITKFIPDPPAQQPVRKKERKRCRSEVEQSDCRL